MAKTFSFVYFLLAFVLMHTWWLAVMTCACQLINYTLATEENLGNEPVCACCNHFPITWNELFHNIQPSNFEYSHKVHFSKSFFRKNIGDFTDLHNEKKNLEVPCKRNHFGYWNLCKCLPYFVNVAVLYINGRCDICYKAANAPLSLFVCVA